MRKVALLWALVWLLVGPAAAQAPIQVMVDGRMVPFDQPPVSVNGRVLVPVRGVFEQLGAEVSFDSATRTVTAIRGADRIMLTLGSYFASVNGRSQRLDSPATVIGGRTLVPLRFVSEAMGANVEWSAAQRLVRITGGGDVTMYPPPVPTGAPIQTVQIETPGPLYPGQELRVLMVARPGGYASFDVGGRTALPMVPEGNGTYRGRYVVQAGDNVPNAQVVGHIRYPDGTSGTLAAPNTVALVSGGGNYPPPYNPPNYGLIQNVSIDGPTTFYQGDVMEIALQGQPGGRAWFMFQDGRTYPMQEGPPGFYRGRYSVPYGEHMQTSVRTFLELPDGRRADRPFPQPISIFGDQRGPYNPPPYGGPIIRNAYHNASGRLNVGQVFNVTLEGAPGGFATFDIIGGPNGLPMQAVGNGVYRGSYQVQPQDNYPNVAVRVRLRLSNGTSDSRQIPGYFAIGGGSHSSLYLNNIRHNGRRNLQSGERFIISADGTPNANVMARIGRITIPMPPNANGRYRGEYIVQPQDVYTNAPVALELTMPDGRRFNAQDNDPVSFNQGGTPIGQLYICNVRHNGPGPITLGERFVIRAEGTPGATMQARIGPAFQLPMREVESGRYRGEYTVRAGDSFSLVPITLEISTADGRRFQDTASAGGVSFNGNLNPPPNPTARLFIRDIQHNGPGPLMSGTTFVITAQATPGQTAVFNIGNAQFPMREVSSGSYRGEYRVGPQDTVQNAPVRVTIRSADGRSETDRARERVSFNTVQPPPPPPPVAQPPSISSVSHNANGPVGAGFNFEVTATGTPGCTATFQIGRSTFPMSESGGGRYRGSYQVRANDRVQNAPVSVTLRNAAGQSTTQNAPAPVTFAQQVTPPPVVPPVTPPVTPPVNPPTAQLIVDTPTNGLRVGPGVQVAGTATPNSAVSAQLIVVSGQTRSIIDSEAARTDTNGRFSMRLKAFNAPPGANLEIVVRSGPLTQTVRVTRQ